MKLTMKIIAIFITVAMAGTALAGSFTPWTGPQDAWPTANGSVKKIVSGTLVYYGLPGRPYQIVGHFQSATVEEALSAVAVHHGNALVALTNEQINGQHFRDAHTGGYDVTLLSNTKHGPGQFLILVVKI
jgi:hypothetical protein